MESMKERPAHGGDVYGVARTLGIDPDELVDFSANINPCGFPPGLRPAVMHTLGRIRHYPDPKYRSLREALSRYHGLSPEEVWIGNGASGLIHLIPRVLRPPRAVIVAPAFSEYEQALRAVAADIRFHHTSEYHGFTLGEAFDLPDADMVFLANPSSPCGTLLPEDRLKTILETLEEKGVWAILDEAFVDFVEEASAKQWIRRFQHLIVLRSFTKFFGIPGIRLGYVLAAPHLVHRLAEQQDPWCVGAVDQAIGSACLQDHAFIAETRRTVAEERQHLFDALTALEGLWVYPSRANYLLLKLTRPECTAAGLQRRLLEDRILIRDAGNFRGLDERFLRVAVRLRTENDRLLAAMQGCLSRE